MKGSVLPEVIQKAVGTEKYTVDKIGESTSEVRIYDNYVLKIQPQSPETENEYQMIKRLNGRLPVPSILAYEIYNGLAYTLMTKVEGKMLCDIDFLQTPELVCDRACGKGTENAVENRCVRLSVQREQAFQPPKSS